MDWVPMDYVPMVSFSRWACSMWWLPCRISSLQRRRGIILKRRPPFPVLQRPSRHACGVAFWVLLPNDHLLYIGHSGCKAMSASSSYYSSLHALVCTVVCCTGRVSFLVWLIPIEAGMTVVIYIGTVIPAQAVGAVKDRHFPPAVVMGLLPGLGAWSVMMAKGGYSVAGGGIRRGRRVSRPVFHQ